MRRAFLVFGVAVAAVAAVPAPAGADPARPTNYDSRVVGVPEGVTAEVVGGDAFLQVQAEEGREVMVLGYEGEPWLRIGADGRVERNRLSPATYLNDDRYAEVTPPPGASATAEPEWEVVAHGGEWTWHDHRIHWMSPIRPAAVEASGGARTKIFDWAVELEVDGEATAVEGELFWVPDVSPIPWIALALVAAGGLAALRRRPAVPLAVSLLVAGAVAVVVGGAEFAEQPSDAASPVVPVVLPVLALVMAAAAVVAVRRRAALAQTLATAAIAVLAPWAFLRLGVLTRPILPTALPAAADRAGTALVLGILAGALVMVVTAYAAATAEAAADDGEVPPEAPPGPGPPGGTADPPPS